MTVFYLNPHVNIGSLNQMDPHKIYIYKLQNNNEYMQADTLDFKKSDIDDQPAKLNE